MRSKKHKEASEKLRKLHENFVQQDVMRKRKKRPPREFMCSECGKTFAKNCSLKDHIVTIHEENPPLVCDLCGYQNLKRVNMVHHMMARHMKRQHVCRICGQAFGSRSVLKNHSLLHSYTKQFQCKLCSKFFAQNSGLTIHLAQTHNQRTFPCQDCDRVFKSYHRLYHHRVTHEGSSSRRSKFVCQVCGWNAFSSTLLKAHEVKHTKEKPFSCSICKSDFAWKQSMELHMRTLHPDGQLEGWKSLLKKKPGQFCLGF